MFWLHEGPDLSKSIWSMFGSDGKSGSLNGKSRLASVVVFGLFGERLSSVVVCDLFGERFSSIVVLVSVPPRLLCGIENMAKETQYFIVFGMQNERKYFVGERENRREIGYFPIKGIIFHTYFPTFIAPI